MSKRAHRATAHDDANSLLPAGIEPSISPFLPKQLASIMSCTVPGREDIRHDEHQVLRDRTVFLDVEKRRVGKRYSYVLGLSSFRARTAEGDRLVAARREAHGAVVAFSYRCISFARLT